MSIFLKNITYRLSLLLVCTFILVASEGYSTELKLEGAVFSLEGEPLGEIEVLPFPGNPGEGKAPFSKAYTRSDGSFSFGVSPGMSYSKSTGL